MSKNGGSTEIMASSIALPQARTEQPALGLLRLIPGVLLLAAVGYAGKLLEKNVGAYAKAHHWTFPNIEYVLWAILIVRSVPAFCEDNVFRDNRGSSVASLTTRWRTGIIKAISEALRKSSTFLMWAPSFRNVS